MLRGAGTVGRGRWKRGSSGRGQVRGVPKQQVAGGASSSWGVGGQVRNGRQQGAWGQAT